ncbi:hypothetical protein M0655_23285 (plasmid) [Gordonia amicalis]|nr:MULTISPECIES: hypothetical protein [Gordonia]MBA5846294.1 hypothetical protein [Gordonia amicalis]MDH3026202.1 hypothetical protein [Gordonia alkanivorans]UOG23698.1 hypothetical protein MTX80_22580 [Gordonia amicalis]UPW16427.1 hypothetical protein M0655_23285 [Gordonia amicalis]
MRHLISKKILVAAGSALVVAGGVAGGAGPASAAPGPAMIFIENGVNIRTAADIDATIVGHGQRGQKFDSQCSRLVPDRRWNGAVTNWVYGTNRATGVKGWTSTEVLEGIFNKIPDC